MGIHLGAWRCWNGRLLAAQLVECIQRLIDVLSDRMRMTDSISVKEDDYVRVMCKETANQKTHQRGVMK